MARHLPLLDATQRRAFDQPSVFNPSQRQLFFALPDWAAQFLETLLAPHSRGGFVLQVGYFKATGRFFSVDRFLAADQAYVQQRYRLGAVEWARYDKVTRFYHRELAAYQPARRIDFSDEALKDPLRFDIEALFAFNWEQALSD